MAQRMPLELYDMWSGYQTCASEICLVMLFGIARLLVFVRLKARYGSHA